MAVLVEGTTVVVPVRVPELKHPGRLVVCTAGPDTRRARWKRAPQRRLDAIVVRASGSPPTRHARRVPHKLSPAGLVGQPSRLPGGREARANTDVRAGCPGHQSSGGHCGAGVSPARENDRKEHHDR
jgi:hypothetical protein